MSPHQLQIFAHHVCQIMNTDHSCFRMGMKSSHRFDIKPSQTSKEWDTVYIDGTHCGNRSGGIIAYSIIVAKELGL